MLKLILAILLAAGVVTVAHAYSCTSASGVRPLSIKAGNAKVST